MPPPRETTVFGALADATRRRILELVRERPGITLLELSEHFPVSRFAVMKHLNQLEQAGLLRRERTGTSKRLYFEPGPLAELRSGWLDRMAGTKRGQEPEAEAPSGGRRRSRLAWAGPRE